jgi:hypothetical protein
MPQRRLVAANPPLCFAVLHVALLGPEAEMLRVHAGGIVASMHNDQPVGDWFAMHLIRNPMRETLRRTASGPK